MAADVEMKEIAQDKAVFGVLLISCGWFNTSHDFRIV